MPSTSSRSPASAAANRASSGIVFHRKYDSREAISCEVSWTTAPSLPSLPLVGCPNSTWYRKNGDCSMDWSTTRMPSSKVPSDLAVA